MIIQKGDKVKIYHKGKEYLKTVESVENYGETNEQGVFEDNYYLEFTDGTNCKQKYDNCTIEIIESKGETNMLEELIARLNKDYEDLDKIFNTVEKCRQESYKLALIENFYDALLDYYLSEECYDRECIDSNVEEIKPMLTWKENVFIILTETFMNFSHPDRFDVWGYDQGWEGTMDVILAIVEEKEKN